MTLPFSVDGKTIRAILALGVGGIGMIGAGYLLWIVLTDIKPEIQQVHADHARFGSRIVEQFSELRDLVADEDQEQTELLQKLCVRMSDTPQEANDCLTFDL